MKTIKVMFKCLLGILVAVTAFQLFLVTSYGNTRAPYGFLVTGKNVEGTKGFQKNIVYLTKEEIESLKQEKNPQDYGLGECWVSGARYSSYDNHGQGNYHYTIADGLDVLTMIQALTTSMPEAYYIYSSDGYYTKLSLSDIGNLKYFAPKDSEGSLSDTPMIALYKTTLATSDLELAQEPEGPAELKAAGMETYVYGQRTATESNNCHFIQGANTVLVGEPVSVIRSDSYRYSILRLHELLVLGTEVREYTFENNGKTETHSVQGIPMQTVLEKMRLDVYMPEGAETYLELVSEDGNSKFTVSRENIEDSMVAWGYADDRDCPAEQTGEMAVYMPGETKEESIFFNLRKLNVVDQNGMIITEIPVLDVPEEPVPEESESPAPEESETPVPEESETPAPEESETPVPEESETPTPEVSESPSPAVTPKTPTSWKAAAANYKSIKLTWKKSSDATGYYIYRYFASSGKYKKIKELKASSSSYTDTGLTTNKKYKYKIRAYKVVGGKTLLLSAASGMVSAKPALKKTSINKITKSKSQGIKLKWKKVAGASGYQIYRSVKKNKGYQKAGAVKKQSVNTFTDKKAKTGQVYYYKIRPYRIVGGKYKYGPFSVIKSFQR